MPEERSGSEPKSAWTPQSASIMPIPVFDIHHGGSVRQAATVRIPVPDVPGATEQRLRISAIDASYNQTSLAWVALALGMFATAILLHGGLDPLDALIILALCFVCELVDSGLGTGYGTHLTPALLLLGYD